MNRFRDIARDAADGLEELLERWTSGSEGAANLDPEALAAELELRRSAGPRDPSKNPLAAGAAGSPEARARRVEIADERAARIGAIRARREQAQREAQQKAYRSARRAASASAEEEYQRFRKNAERVGASGSAGGRPPIGSDQAIAKHYQTLHLPYGADLKAVKSAYRKLMRKYHPDMHNQSAKKQKAATELSVQVAQAYAELEKHLS